MPNISQTETEIQNSQHPDEGYSSVDSHGTPLGPQTQTVNDSNMQEVLKRDPLTQFMITTMSDGVQNQSSRQALMASIRARRSFIDITDLSSDMNPDSAMVIENTLVKMAKALNRDIDEESSVTCSDNKDNFDEISIYKDSYTLEH